MNLSKFSKWAGASVMAATLAVAPFTAPAQAQYAEPETYDGVEEVETENDFDWGWLGLLGLLGLAGLAGKKRREPSVSTTDYVTNDPTVGVRPGSDYHR
ncbi:MULTISPECIES: WGxxGxxG family protein [unclassified Coleofasciculus]|uniref:WGxxGxxG family protein n=1 Tax=unclassified Coleofasciculus TaxID=2692782 RepID=UPI00187DDB69|nr:MULTISPECIES: WGxxGxxG family protein [unclassified Coleofasciculus]MBE9125391.1 WGxxGxxG-CTERM domain-containing protein [Coleofasciculus sp. LEGE 07081]MBE9147392.1 WGxxGxxG-CTERM domain-containing protein [Coleofasciculus sp. LEGE 07092]